MVVKVFGLALNDRMSPFLLFVRKRTWIIEVPMRTLCLGSGSTLRASARRVNTRSFSAPPVAKPLVLRTRLRRHDLKLSRLRSEGTNPFRVLRTQSHPSANHGQRGSLRAVHDGPPLCTCTGGCTSMSAFGGKAGITQTSDNVLLSGLRTDEGPSLRSGLGHMFALSWT